MSSSRKSSTASTTAASVASSATTNTQGRKQPCKLEHRSTSTTTSTPRIPPRKLSAPAITASGPTTVLLRPMKKPVPPPVQPQRKTSAALSTTLVANNNRRSSLSSLAFNTPALVTGGLIGCAAGAAILLAVGIWYDFAGIKAAISAAREARLCVDNVSDEIIKRLSSGTYNADEALDVLKRTALSYASVVPEGAPLIERIFREIDTVKATRGSEIEELLSAAYADLQAASGKGADVKEMKGLVLKHLGQLSLLGRRALQDVAARNPRTIKPASKSPGKFTAPVVGINGTLPTRPAQAIAA